MKLNIKHLTKDVGKFVAEQSPQILTVLGVAGTIGTAYLVGKASYKANDVLRENKLFDLNNGPAPAPLTDKEKFLLTWKLYVTPAAVGVMTIGCIVAANRVQARRFAALAAAYGVLSGDFDEFRDKAAEKLGLKKTDELNSDIAKKRIESANLPPNVVLGDGKTWFYDKNTGRTIPSTMETIKAGMNKVNFQCNTQKDATLNDFYREIEWPTVEVGDILGWNSSKLCDVHFTPILTDTHGAVTAFEFVSGPFPN